MRVFCAAAIIALLSGPAFAQMSTKGDAKPPPPGAKTQTEIDADKAAERAYKNSLGNIPDQAPADPWGGARNIDTHSDKKTGAVKKKPPA
jgi:hypothetical protein